MANFYNFGDSNKELSVNLDTITYFEEHSQTSTKIHLLGGEIVIVSKEYSVVRQLIERHTAK